MISASLIKQKAAELADELLHIRRHLHKNPELSFQEFKTSSYLKSRLEKSGLSRFENKAGTGFTLIISGKNPESKTIALRADMDALPIQEENDKPYTSQNPGVMHACGHDVHSACLWGAATLLNQVKDDFEGTIKLLFQPGEELLPGGASLMIADGALEHPKPQQIIGQHVMPFLPVGTVGFRSGLYMASSDEIYIKIKGKGGHGAMPHLSNDPVPVAAQVILALQQLVSRKANPLMPSVLTIGKVEAAGATNVIPQDVNMQGTFRTLDETWRAEAHRLIENCIKHTAEAWGMEAELEIRKGYPFLKNDEELTGIAKQAAIDYLGAEKVIDLDIWMASEDFAYYSQVMPACFYRLGVRNEEKGIIHGVHHPKFDIDEQALEIGAGLMAWIALNALESK